MEKRDQGLAGQTFRWNPVCSHLALSYVEFEVFRQENGAWVMQSELTPDKSLLIIFLGIIARKILNLQL